MRCASYPGIFSVGAPSDRSSEISRRGAILQLRPVHPELHKGFLDHGEGGAVLGKGADHVDKDGVEPVMYMDVDAT